MNANRLRTSLTMLGIIIGIASVVLLLALGDSMKRFVSNELQLLGTNMLFIVPGNELDSSSRWHSGSTQMLTAQDAFELNKLPSLRGASPAVQGKFTLSTGNESLQTTVIGVTPVMFELRNWKIGSGYAFSNADLRANSRVVVIGRRIADRFFPNVDPLSKSLRIENISHQVVGVINGEGKQPDGGDLSDLVVIPATTARSNLIRTVADGVHYIVAQGVYNEPLQSAIDEINECLRDRHKIKTDDADDFHIENLASLAQKANTISGGVAAVLGIIGAISIVVGGIGIMNIMLVSVTERTREIGIRLAIGARPTDVLLQFLIESMILCLAGGIIGVSIAIAVAWAITSTGQVDVQVSFGDVVLACIFSTFVGILFGFFPARRASKLQPVECLRYE